jgi:hypothetical protein
MPGVQADRRIFEDGVWYHRVGTYMQMLQFCTVSYRTDALVAADKYILIGGGNAYSCRPVDR